MIKRNVLEGIMFIVAAILIVCSQFGLLENVNIASIILAMFLGIGCIKGIIYRKFEETFFSAVLLYVIFDTSLGLPDLEFWPGILIAIFVSIGIRLIFPRHRVLQDWQNTVKHGFEQSRDSEVIFGEDISYANEESEVNCSVSFGSSIKYITSTYFQQANMRCSFGELKVYFDNVTPANGSCVANVDVSFGDIKIYVPRTWQVKNNMRLSLAGIKEIGRSEANSESNCLYIEGNASFAGIEVIYI